MFQETKEIPKITYMKTETYQNFTRPTARELKFRNERSRGTLKKAHKRSPPLRKFSRAGELDLLLRALIALTKTKV